MTKGGLKQSQDEEVIARAAKEILDRCQRRKSLGREAFFADWQASLEFLLLMMRRPFSESPGRVLPMVIGDEKEWDFYIDLEEKLDLPPEICAMLVTPTGFEEMPIPPSLSPIKGLSTAAERGAYSLLMSHCHDFKVVMQVSLPGLETVGIDVYDDGSHLADYSYNSIEECLEDLTRVTWIYFNPGEVWTEEQIKRYTENWHAKSLHTDIEHVALHTEFSYAHHPELLSFTPLQSVFKLVVATIPEEYHPLDKAIETANSINQDLDLGYATITKEGILRDDPAECQALLSRIVVEIDMHLDSLQYLEEVKFAERDNKDGSYRQTFDRAAREVYQAVTGRVCPEALSAN